MCGGCCKKAPVTDEYGSAIIYKKYEDRSCTDMLFCLLFAIFWVVMVAIAGIAIGSGDPDRLLYATNYEGKTCGTADTGVDNKWVYYPRIVEDILMSQSTNPLDIKLYGVCMSACPKVGDVVCDAAGETALTALMDHEGTTERAVAYSKTLSAVSFVSLSAQGQDPGAVKGGCWIVPLDTADYFYRCIWKRNKAVSVNSTCLTPAALYGVDLNAATTTQEMRDACITKRQTTTEAVEGEAAENPMLTQMFNAADAVGRYVSDASKASLVIWLCGALLAVVCGFVFLFIARKFAGCMVWTTIIVVIVVLTVGTLFAYYKSGLLEQAGVSTVTDSFAQYSDAATVPTADSPDITSELPGEVTAATSADMETRWKYFSYFMTAVTLIVIVLVIAWRKKIKIAVAVIKEASEAVARMPLMLVLPILTTVFVMILLVYFLFIASFISSSGDISTQDVVDASNSAVTSATGQSLLCSVNATTGQLSTTACADAKSVTSVYQSSSLNDYLLAIHFFGFLWTNQFIQAIGIMIVAGAVSQYYFARDKKEDLPRFPVKESAAVAFRYHLGSMAFGSLVIAIVQFIRAVLEYLNKQSQSAQKKNIVLRILFKCIRCCLWCFEKCIKFLTSYAYILIAMQGMSFCGACKDVVKMILDNPVQIGVVNGISGIIFFLGKLSIVGFCTFAAFMWIDNDSQFQAGGANALEGYSFPLLLVLVMSFTIAALFMNVFGLSVDTILMCFLFDRKLNNGEDKPYYMSKRLLKAIGASTKENKKITGEESDDSDDEDGGGAAPTPADDGAAAGGGGGGALL